MVVLRVAGCVFLGDSPLSYIHQEEKWIEHQPVPIPLCIFQQIVDEKE